MNNGRQMMLSWRMYAEDNGEKVPSAWAMPTRGWRPQHELDGRSGRRWGQSQQLGYQLRHSQKLFVALLLEESRHLEMPGRYLRGPGHLRAFSGRTIARVRSGSMLSWFNGSDADHFPGCSGYAKYGKLSEVNKPGPAMTFVFLDERFDSINDGEFCTSMSGYPDQPRSST